MKNRFLFVFLIFCCAQMFWGGEVWGQSCSSCTYTFSSNNGTGDPTIANNSDGQTICITASNRTASINFNNAKNVNICIAEGASVNNNKFSSLSSVKTINNYGNLTVSQDFNGGSSYTIVNSKTGTLNYTAGSVKGNIVSSGTLNISSGTVDGSITNTGALNFTANDVTFNNSSSVSTTGTTSFTGTGQVQFNSTFTSQGSLNINGSVQVNSNGKITLVGTSTIKKDFKSNAYVNLAGALNVNGNLEMINSGGTIGALNANQCNSVNVTGTFKVANEVIHGNNLDYMGSGSALYVNKMPVGENTSTPLGGNAKVGSCPSVNCLEINEVISSTQRSITYIFRCSGEFTPRQLLADEDSLIASTLIVAGGGGGGFGDYAGGGGAGGLIYNYDIPLVPNSTYQVTVGTGGIGAPTNNIQGFNGTNTSFNGLIAIGGGGGGSDNSPNGKSGGSGGGASGSNGSYGVGSIDQGNAGGKGEQNGQHNIKGGGGGGSSTSGDNAPNGNKEGGEGGNGKSSSILGSNTIYAAGGGGTGKGQNAKKEGLGGSSSIGGNGNVNGRGLSGTQNTGSGGGAGTAGGGSGSNGIAIIKIVYIINPVEFLYFNTTYQKETKSSLLNWSTAKEWENSHFEIERAVNSVDTWETIGRVEGAGYSQAPVEYNYTDIALPKSGGNIFYRLKQVDFSGKYSYSRTRAIQVEAAEGMMTWIAYPNPSLNGSDISIALTRPDLYQDELIYLRLVNMLGNGDSQILTSPDDLSQVVSEWLRSKKAGLYLLDIRWGDHTQQIKLLRN